jgi:drug/metabolite transporter (DMT)-like permease
LERSRAFEIQNGQHPILPHCINTSLSLKPTTMTSPTHRTNLIGIFSLVLGIFVFSIQDAIIKAISGDHAVTLAIFIRAIVAFPVLLTMVHFECGLKGLITKQWRVLLCAYTTYFMAFPALPLAEAIALFFMVPLLVTIMSGPLLGEKVTALAWAAVAIGLVGVFIILQPGSALFNPAALLSLVSAATYALSMILARKYGGETPSSVMSFYQNIVYLIGASAFAGIAALLGMKPPGHPSFDFLFRNWDMPNSHDLLLMGACGVIAAVGMTLLTHAYRKGQANIITPFEYTGMIWAVVFGFAFFDEVPRATTFIGMALIAAAGILALTAGVKNIEQPAPIN